jgi:mannose-6-phosphate isomerase-like protein (cupin superfamily)
MVAAHRMKGMAFRFTSIEELGEGVFRKLRQELGVTAFGINAMVLPPGAAWFEHYHEEQDEVYFVHRGRAGFEIEGETFELGPGGACHVESTTPRRVWNAGDEDLVLLAIGGKDGYVGRDGQLVHPDDVERRRAVSAGDMSALPRRR